MIEALKALVALLCVALAIAIGTTALALPEATRLVVSGFGDALALGLYIAVAGWLERWCAK
ncbi:hypothetical protein [Andreprevotia chitinilytica]|uniref:hypothetical protein n=1 Tax=Andreprevotia chitinilytica TaxID=396808 RepID=UPI00055749C4|nr:hypothetical protein [Andreprevotia chitinilytica]